MSTFSGIGGKGDKGSNKYKSLNINNIYQGKSVPTQKSTGKQFTFNRKKHQLFLYQILKKIIKIFKKNKIYEIQKHLSIFIGPV